MSTAPSAEPLSVPITPVAMPRRERRSRPTLRRDIPSWRYRTLAISSLIVLGALWWASHRELLPNSCSSNASYSNSCIQRIAPISTAPQTHLTRLIIATTS